MKAHKQTKTMNTMVGKANKEALESLDKLGHVLRAYISPKLTEGWHGCLQNWCQPVLGAKLRFGKGPPLAMILDCCHLFVTMRNMMQDSIHTSGSLHWVPLCIRVLGRNRTNTVNEDLLEFPQYGLGGPTMTVSHWKDWELSSCSFLEANYVSIPNWVLKAWGVPGELLSFSLDQKLQMLGSGISVRDCVSSNNSSNSRVVALTSEMQRHAGKKQTLPLRLPEAASHAEGRVFTFQLM